MVCVFLGKRGLVEKKVHRFDVFCENNEKMEEMKKIAAGKEKDEILLLAKFSAMMDKMYRKGEHTMKFDYAPRGVCARKFTIEVENGKIGEISVMGGCNGNLQGLAALLRGMDVNEAITRLEGIRCGFKSTSCPDQMAQALKTVL